MLNVSNIGKYSPYNNLPEFSKTDNTNADKISFTEGGTPAPVDVSISQLNSETYLCDLVRLSLVDITENEGKTYATTDGESIQLFDKFKIMEAALLSEPTSYTVTGILVIYKDSYQLYPTAIGATVGIQNTTISTFDPSAPVFNTAGQRVSPNYKGIVIQSGKKFVK